MWDNQLPMVQEQTGSLWYSGSPNPKIVWISSSAVTPDLILLSAMDEFCLSLDIGSVVLNRQNKIQNVFFYATFLEDSRKLNCKYTSRRLVSVSPL